VIFLLPCCSDLTFVVVCVPFIAYHYAAENWTIGEFTCKLSQYLIYVTTYVTVYTLVAVAAVRVCKVSRAAAVSHSSVSTDTSGRTASATTIRSCTAFRCRCYIRFFACGRCYPSDRWDNHSRRAVGAIVASLWAVSLFANVPVCFLYRVKTTAEQQFQAEVAYSAPYVYCGVEDELNGRRITLAFFVFAYMAPLASIATMYFRLLRQLRRKQRESSISSIDSGRNQRLVVAESSIRSTTANGGPGIETTIAVTPTVTVTPMMTRNGTRRTSHVTRVLVVVVAVFAVCWLPLHVHLLVVYSGAQPTGRWYQVYRVLAQCLAYSNSCMNPVIYSYVSTDFRRQFAEIMFGLWARTCRRVGGNGARATATGDEAVEDNGDVDIGGEGAESNSQRQSKRRRGRCDGSGSKGASIGRRHNHGDRCGRVTEDVLSPPRVTINRCTSSVISTICITEGTTADIQMTAL